MRTHLATAALGLAVLVSAAASAQAWQTFKSPQGKFSVQVPGTPKFEMKTIPSAAGQLKLNNWTVATHGGATAYVISFTDYPAAITSKANPQKMLMGARDGQLRNLKATASSDQAITMNGNPGRDVNFKSANGFTGRCKMFLVKNRLYQVLALTTNNAAPPSDFAKFVNSFQLGK